jgi:NAD(P)-dependent dehydrogenase (short-subunit alcohol dehydrogenase family)
MSWVQCDLRDSAAVDNIVWGAAETLGGLDVLLHAAGLWQPGIPGQITVRTSTSSSTRLIAVDGGLVMLGA